MSDTITVVGNIAAEPEQRHTHGGHPFTSFRVGSTSRRYDSEKGQWVDDGTSWFRVLAYRRLGEHAFASLHRGQRVIVTGRLQVREWESGERRGTSVEIIADSVGHDLLFGVSQFQKAPPLVAGSPPRADGTGIANDQRAEAITDDWVAAVADGADDGAVVPF